MKSKNKRRPIPERLIEARKNAGLSTGATAERLHLTRAGISQYETGKSAPAWPILKMLALSYGTSVEWLCGETDDPSPDQILLDADDKRSARLLAYYQRLSGADKDLLDGLAGRLLEAQTEEES